MAKNPDNVLKFIASDIQIGLSAAGSEPSSYVSLGLTQEATVTIKCVPILEPEGGGSEVQKGYDCSVEVPVMEVLSAGTIESTYRNLNVWIKCIPIGTPSSTNPIVRAKNFLANIGVDLDLSAKGKSVLKLSGKKLANILTDFYTTAAS